MYPTISDLLQDLLGINFPLPIQTFGFFMALSFAAAYWFTNQELIRKENAGLLLPQTKLITINKPLEFSDYAIHIGLYALIGFKLLEMVIDYDALVQNPQIFILSTKGNFFGAIIGAAYGYYEKHKEALQLKGKNPSQERITIKAHEQMGNILGLAAVGGILGAKIFHNLENLDEFAANPIEALFSFSGLTFYGGLIVAAVLIIRHTNKNGIACYHMVDSAAVGLMIAYGIGRIGCHLSGDGDWGIENFAPKPSVISFLPDWFWAYQYPNNVINEGIAISGCIGNHCYMLPNPVFPTPLYEAIISISIALILWAVRKQFKLAGQIFFTYLICNGIERFLIEKIRVNNDYHLFGQAFTQAELISFSLIIAGIFGLLWTQKQAQKNKTLILK
jgi:phosphatidylglycerol:prolipoprotein diacylglycerol transferase